MGKRMIEITEKDLKKLYVDKLKTTYEIGDIYNCHRSVVSRNLKKYGIKIKKHKRQYDFYYGQSLNETQNQLILGSLMGDGCVSKHHEGENDCRFIEQHCVKQLYYLKMKKDILNNFVSREIQFTDNSKNNSFGNGFSCSFSTVLHKEFKKYYEMFYVNNKKTIPYFDLKPFSLAIWYYDDGSLDTFKRNGKNIATFHTQGFDDSSIKNARKMLLDNFNITTYIVHVKNKKYRVIRMNSENTQKLLNIVKNYSVPCLSYKLGSIDNPVETYPVEDRVSVLKCSDANTFGSLLSQKEMMV